MELHQLRYVLAVAQTGNFSRAALRCNVSQPSLSQQILKLEEELGERLFERSRQQSRLTAAGERFLPRAARILDEITEAKREAQDAHDLVRGEVSIGVLPTIAPYFLPPIVAAFRKKHPGVSIVIHEETTAVLHKLAAGYEIDFALASLPFADPQMEVVPLFSEELLLAIPPGHPLAREQTVPAAEVGRHPLVVMKEGHCLGDQALDFCAKRGLRPAIVSRSAQVETIQSLVVAGLGLSLIPAMAGKCAGCGRRPVYRSIAGRVPRRTVVAFWPKKRPLDRPAEAFFREIAAAGAPARQDRKIKNTAPIRHSPAQR